jgi:hypothetical protein
MLSNKLNKIEIEYNNPSVYSPSTVQMNTAEIIMNEIFNECADGDCCPINKHPYDDEIEKNEENNLKNTPPPATQIIDEIEVIDEIFDLKKDISADDKESVISASVNGGHAAKKALMKLSLDKLKTKCEEREISTEGTKNQLADRIIIFDNENSQE